MCVCVCVRGWLADSACDKEHTHTISGFTEQLQLLVPLVGHRVIGVVRGDGAAESLSGALNGVSEIGLRLVCYHGNL